LGPADHILVAVELSAEDSDALHCEM
jgi:hypothetical protein